MRVGIQVKTVVLFGLLMVVSLANYVKLNHAVEEASRQLKWVEHTYEVIITSEILLGQLRDAETGQRGYLLTGDAAYLEPYHSGVDEATRCLKALFSLTIDNPAQQEKLRQVGELIELKFAELSETIELVRSGDTKRALAVVKEDFGKKLMGQIRTEFGKFQKVEQQLLLQREAAYQRSQKQLEFLFVAEAGVLVFLIIAISLYVQKAFVSPLVAMAREAERSEWDVQNFKSASSSTDEIGTLARALASMHRVVAERTKALETLSEELKRERDRAVHFSATDSLTGLYNRRKFEEVIENELKRARRDGRQLDLTLLDIDFFKRVNDTYGHAKGDEVLKAVAKSLQSMCRRPADFVFRVGGEEFVFLTSKQDASSAATFVDQLRANVEGLGLPNQGSKVSEYVTVSAGVVSLIPGADDTVDSLLRLADHRLYKAKTEGRNRVVASD